MIWHGSKACLKKNLSTFNWLRNIKNKKYSWRLDTYFSKNKYTEEHLAKWWLALY